MERVHLSLGISAADDDEQPTTLVTGGCGFIGFALCRRLTAAGHRVVAYDDLSRGRAENLPEGARLIQGDIRDRGRLAEAVSAVRPDAVIHLAAIHYLPDCAARPRETQEVNVDGTRHVLEACRDRVRHVVFASSAAVYASVDVPCSEDRTPVVPIEVYGESKLEGERLVEAFCRETGVAATTVRISNAIGRRETNPHVVPHIFESLRGSNQVPLGSVEARRDYIDTRDIADAILAVHEAAAGYQVFNVGTGVAHSVDEIVGLLGRMLGRRIEIVRDASRLRPVERMLLVADISKIRRATGWAPRVTLEERGVRLRSDSARHLVLRALPLAACPQGSVIGPASAALFGILATLTASVPIARATPRAPIRPERRPLERRATLPRLQQRRRVSLRHLADRNPRDFLEAFRVDDENHVVTGRGDIRQFAVGRERQPLRMLADEHAADFLQVGQRVHVGVAVHLAGGPQRLAVGRDGQTMGRGRL